MEANKFRPPPSAWRANRRMRASAWSSEQLSGEDHVCKTLPGTGDLAPDEDAPAWSFHLGLPETLGQPEATHLANGYVLEFPHLADPPRIACLAVERDIYAAYSSLDLRPTLFSPGQTVTEDGDDQWLRLKEQTVLLRVRKAEDGTHFVICFGSEADDIIEQRAEKGSATDVMALVQTEFSLRAPYWKSLAEVAGDFSLVADAMEEVVFHLESPTDSYPHRWSAAQVPRRREFAVNQLYPLVLTWLDLDAAVARDLVEGVLSAVGPDGSLAATMDPGTGSNRGSAAAWPYLARSVLAIGDDALSTGAFDTIRANLTDCLRQFDPDRTGLLRWRTADESFIPDTFDQHIASPALAAFMLSEFEALEKLLRQCGDDSGLGESLLESQERIHAQLAATLWDGEHNIYRDCYVDGASTSRATLAGLMPLAWDHLPANRRAELLTSIESSELLGATEGVTLWQEWENDASPPPIPAGYQYLLLETLVHEADQEVKQRLQDALAEAILREAPDARSFPTDLRAMARPTGDAQSLPTGIDVPVMGACLALDVLPNVYRRHDSDADSAFWTALDRHRYTIMAAVVVIPSILVLGTALHLARKPTAQQTSVPKATGLVQELMRQGKLNEALKLIEEDTAEDPDGSQAFTRAAIRFHMGDLEEAEREYRALIETGERIPSATLNLALTLFKKGDFDAAFALYQKCSTEFATSNPRVAERAEEASRFIRLHRDTL